jgi:hypothetical protein
MKHRRLFRIATLGLTVAALAAPTAMADTQDLVSPDARDAAQAQPVAGTPGTIDRRSPDAQDAADGRGTWNAPKVTVVKVSGPAPASTGLDWGDAGIGAGAVVGLMLIALGGVLAVIHRRQTAQHPQRPATTA